MTAAPGAKTGSPGRALVTAYLAARFRPVEIVPLALVIALAGQIDAAPPSIASWLASAGPVLLLLLRWRIRDDLADRAADRVAHPERLLVRTADVRPVRNLGRGAAMLLVAAAALAAPASPRARSILAVTLVLETAGLAYYGAVRRRVGSLAGALLLLAKYPLMTVACRPWPARGTALGPAVIVYATLFLFEVLHDARVRSARGAGWAAGLAIALVGAAAGRAGHAAVGLAAVAGLALIAAPARATRGRARMAVLVGAAVLAALAWTASS